LDLGCAAQRVQGEGTPFAHLPLAMDANPFDLEAPVGRTFPVFRRPYFTKYEYFLYFLFFIFHIFHLSVLIVIYDTLFLLSFIFSIFYFFPG